MCEATFRRRDPDLVHRLLEKLAVLTYLDRLDLRSNELNAVLLEDALLVKLYREIQSRLAANGRKESIGTLLFDDRGDRFDGERLNVGPIRDLGICHDRRRVRVHQNDL